ncbi:MAG: lipA [Parachlamydiales bacterium]|nr:lipA [Parachlamydiales bacterium]
MNRLKGRFPHHLHRSLPSGCQMSKTNAILRKYRLNTVCEEAKCPNRLECYSKHTATFLALGKYCTRNCGFCAIGFSKTLPPPEADEPDRIAHVVRELELAHAVITMVSRDDLPDGGAGHMAAIIRAVRRENPAATLEVLTSDFGGEPRSLDLVLDEHPEIFNHNLETVRALSLRIRHLADYDRSLAVLRHAKQSARTQFVKSGIMLGLGETDAEVRATIEDLAHIGCDIIAIGQYLQPSAQKLRVKEFISLETFQAYEQFGRSLGVPHMYCGPFVRSDYNADLFINLLKTDTK